MATISGVFTGIQHLRVDKDVAGYNLALVTFTLAGTYAQADNATLTAVPTGIALQRRDGKKATILHAMCGIPATKASNPTQQMSLGPVTVVGGTDLTFAVMDNGGSEIADGTLPSQDRPFSVVIAFTEGPRFP
ncbi:MAG: hypothetical protein SFV15_16820 [Polyangiaceae bacterium]|nr:hypothetical protein [Polyangiaceae bacterium]